MEKLLTTTEAAQLANLSRQWFERQRWLGTGPKYIKLGHAVRYRALDIEDLFRQRIVSPLKK